MQLYELFETVEIRGTVRVTSIDKENPYDETATNGEPFEIRDYDRVSGWDVDCVWAEGDCLRVVIDNVSEL